jgi:hypothetical protein
LKDAMKECRKKLDAFDREQYTQHRTKSPEWTTRNQIKLKQLIAEAKAQVDKEKIDTLK